jgi:hypothetical protein
VKSEIEKSYSSVCIHNLENQASDCSGSGRDSIHHAIMGSEKPPRVDAEMSYLEDSPPLNCEAHQGRIDCID